MKTGIKSFIVKNHYLVIAVLCFLVGGVLALLCLIQKIPLIFGVLGVFILTGALSVKRDIENEQILSKTLKPQFSAVRDGFADGSRRSLCGYFAS